MNSNTFNFEMKCPDSIDAFEPDTLLSGTTPEGLDADPLEGFEQTRDASSDTSSWPYFKYDSFQTKTKACPV